VCAGPSCADWIQKECTGWQNEVERAMPTIVVRAIGHDGCDLDLARVLVDGETLATRIEGQPLRIDPGPHVVRVEAANDAPVEQRIVLSAGEKNRRLFVSFARPGAACTPAPRASEDRSRSSLSPAAVGVGAVGLLALGVGAALDISFWAQKPEFDRCRPACDPARADPWQMRGHVAEVLLGVGALTLAGAAYLFFAGMPHSSKSATVRTSGLVPTQGMD
jgi:hypothetical protein